MTKTTALTESFAAGEVTPLLSGRVSTEGYKQGVAYLRNMLTDPRGPIFRRPGFEHIGSIPAKAEAQKFSMELNQVEGFDLTFTDLKLTVAPNKVQRLGEETLANGSFILGKTGWKDESTNPGTAEFIDNKCILTPGIAPSGVAKVSSIHIIKDLAANHTLEIFGTFPAVSSGEGCEIHIGTSPSASDVYSTILYGDIKYHTFPVSAAAIAATPILYISIIANLQTSESSLEDVRPNILDSISLKPEVSTPNTVDIVSPYTEAEVREIQGVPSPDGNSMYFCHINYTPYKLTESAGVWALTAVAFTAIPSEWGVNNYPGTMGFFQGRSFWGGLPNNPETFWASNSGAFENLTIGTLAAEGFKYKIAAEGIIRWIIGYKNLLIGTNNGEHVVSSESGILTSSDVQVDQQSAFGSGTVQPIKLGTEVLYVSPDGRKLRTMGYSWTDSGWISQDLTEASEHITIDPIVSLAYARNPDSVIWMATASGGLISCAYRHIGGTTPVIGWHRHELEGVVLSVSVLEEDGTSYLWIAIRRILVGSPYISYEKLLQLTESIFTDGTVIQKLNSITSTVIFLDHLEGHIVYPIVDGATHPAVVVSSGQIVLDTPGYVIAVGTHTSAKVVTLPLVLYAAGLPIIHGPKRWVNIEVLLHNSALPLIEGVRPPDRDPSTLMGLIEPLTNGLVAVPQLGWEKGSVTIEQDLPLPLTIVALTGEAKHNTL